MKAREDPSCFLKLLVALGIPEGLEMIKAAGFDCVTTYRRRKPELHKL